VADREVVGARVLGTESEVGRNVSGTRGGAAVVGVGADEGAMRAMVGIERNSGQGVRRLSSGEVQVREAGTLLDVIFFFL
jgi:hypothetical protein